MRGVDHAKLRSWRSPASRPSVEAFEEVALPGATASRWIKPCRVRFRLADAAAASARKDADWDCIRAHDAVAVLCYHRDRDAFILVRQFRPPVCRAEWQRTGRALPLASPTSAEPGMTLELVAGVLPAGMSEAECASAELLEEAGFRVASSRLERVSVHAAGVGASGNRLTVFFATVGAADEVPGAGGGLLAEGERTEPLVVPVCEVEELLRSDDVVMPGGLMWALQYGLERVTRERRERRALITHAAAAVAGVAAGFALAWFVARRASMS